MFPSLFTRQEKLGRRLYHLLVLLGQGYLSLPIIARKGLVRIIGKPTVISTLNFHVLKSGMQGFPRVKRGCSPSHAISFESILRRRDTETADMWVMFQVLSRDNAPQDDAIHVGTELLLPHHVGDGTRTRRVARQGPVLDLNLVYGLDLLHDCLHACWCGVTIKGYGHAQGIQIQPDRDNAAVGQLPENPCIGTVIDKSSRHKDHSGGVCRRS